MDDPAYARALRIPHAEPGMSIGLFGGSFNPPHEGHVHVALLALQRARLDRVWWMVTPGNPLKEHDGLPSLEKRIALCRKMIRHPKVEITGFEAMFGTNYTEETLRRLIEIRPHLRFVWVMGADNLADFHRWQNWRQIAAMMPILIVDRPGSTLSYRSAPAAIALSRYRVDESDAPLLASLEPPAWCFVHGPRSSVSSTALRRAAAQQN